MFGGWRIAWSYDGGGGIDWVIWIVSWRFTGVFVVICRVSVITFGVSVTFGGVSVTFGGVSVTFGGGVSVTFGGDDEVCWLLGGVDDGILFSSVFEN